MVCDGRSRRKRGLRAFVVVVVRALGRLSYQGRLAGAAEFEVERLRRLRSASVEADCGGQHYIRQLRLVEGSSLAQAFAATVGSLRLLQLRV